MNWGKGVAIVMIAFIAFITIMIVGFFQHSVDLEENDYYQQEITYEDEITQLKNANKFEHKPVINITQSHLTVQFPAEVSFSNIHLLLKRPDDETADKTYSIEDTKFFTIDKEELRNGKYNVELKYEANGDKFLQKEMIYL